MRKFNDWRKSDKVKTILTEPVRPVFNGPNDNNEGPYAWMFVNKDRSEGLLIAVGASNQTVDSFKARLRWLDENKRYKMTDVTLNNDGVIQNIFCLTKSGEELISDGFMIAFGNSSSRGKAYWIEEEKRHEQ
jgi:hypothetical protein